jgi:imidazolonepropionase-like amidohydrolase
MKSGTAKVLLVCAFLACGAMRADDVYLIRDARVVTVSGPVLPKASVLIDKGLIAEVGARVKAPPGAKVVEGAGLTVYPGLFDAGTILGLTEVGQVTVTNDHTEMGKFMPHLTPFSAVHMSSELIPVARSNGTTHALVRPRGGIIPGQASVLSLDGWTPEEMEISLRAALVIDFPRQMVFSSSFMVFGPDRRRPYAETKKEYEGEIRQLKEFFTKARHYLRAKSQPAGGEWATIERQYEALIPALSGRQTVLISADTHVDIKAAVRFAQEEKLDFVLLSASDAWRVTDFLKEENVRVILGPPQTLPRREDDPIEIIYRTPGILHSKGVSFAISTGSAADSRNLPYEAANAVAYGLPYEEALRSITLSPAEFLGIADQVGSIEKGKKANLVIANGDILEYQTEIKQMFINGRPVSLENRHTRLYERYRNRK